jgi:hypothetical protein
MSGMTAPSYNQDFYQETIGLTLEFLSDILIEIQEYSDSASEKEYFRNLRLTQLASSVSKFVELTTLLSKTNMVKKNFSIPGIKESHIHLLFILKGINQAQMKQDSVALDELIKYELKDNLTQWKIDLIPLIKKALNS